MTAATRSVCECAVRMDEMETAYSRLLNVLYPADAMVAFRLDSEQVTSDG